MEYTIVQGYSKEDVIGEVNKLLEDDWKLYGNLCLAAAPLGSTVMVYFAQAMTRNVFVGVFAQGVAEGQE